MTPFSLSPLLQFLNTSPTAWHAVANLLYQLKNLGFQELDEKELWSIELNQKYVVTRNGSALCAFITPKKLPQRARVLASHTDSPGFKLKPQPEIRKHQAILFGVEVYGAPLLSSWLNRDLGIAGRIFYQNNQGELNQTLVNLTKYPLMIPQLAIHLDREVNEKGLQLNKQEHLNALVGLSKFFPDARPVLETLIADQVSFQRLWSHDLFLYPLEEARLIGYDQQLLASYRLDSLVSVHAAISAFTSHLEPLEDEIKLVVFWDNEEVGSHTAQGAESSFFQQTFERIMSGLSVTREQYFCILNRSNCFSIDLAHALHPNYAEKHDAHHQPFLGQGAILKTNAQQRYATDAQSSYPLQILAALKNIPLQSFVSRNDMPCGSTIGPLQACETGMPTVDLGCGQLSMHSCRELMASQDYIFLCQLLSELLETKEWPQIIKK
jgi:aspartyl aminopeptidase